VDASSARPYVVDEPVVMMNGEITRCQLACHLACAVQGIAVQLDCLVSEVVPGYDMLLGMDAVRQLGGLYISPDGASVTFNGQVVQTGALSSDLAITDKDFSAVFRGGRWVIKWHWTDGSTAPVLMNRVESYRVPDDMQPDYDAEIQEWIRCGWLQPFDGECEGLVPLMAVFQGSKDKVRPVLDYRELNQYVSSHTANGDVCSEKLRAWRRMGSNVSIIDLRKAYLQLHVDPSLWKYQVVAYQGRRYCLTRLGFGLNVAPKVMTAVLHKVLSMDPLVRAGTDSYVDDIITNNDVVTNEQVISLLRRYGLEVKPPERLVGGRVLGLRVKEKDGVLTWSRDNKVESLDRSVTRRQLFSWCGQLTAHFPVAGWLRSACSYIKRATNDLAWDAEITDGVRRMAEEISHRVANADPVSGTWNVPQSTSGRVWCDASSLALGVCLQIGGHTVEDASWLRKADDAAHINLAELEAVIKGLNMALAWDLRDIELLTDSATVYSWLRSVVEEDKPLRTRGLGEALARRRTAIIGDIIKEYGLRVRVTLVRSADNKADQLTRVPQTWLKPVVQVAATARVRDVDLRSFHDLHHLGVDRTLYLARLCFPDAVVRREEVKRVVQSCVRCRSVDPAPVTWSAGSLEVDSNWYRLAVDVTWFSGEKYLTLVDSGPSRFAIWRRSPNESESSVIRNLE